MTTLTSETMPLLERWEAYQKEHPKTRRRDAAAALGVSEAELVATGCGHGVTRLAGDWKELFPLLGDLGETMALTRNEAIVHETTGVYENISFDGKVGMALGKKIDLRFFMFSWGDAFALHEDTPKGMRRSIQFFDKNGTAIHKVYLRNEEAADTFDSLVKDWRSENQSPEQSVDPIEAKDGERPDEEIDVEALRADWKGMTDTHQFFGMLQKHNVARTQAFRLMDSEFAYRVDHVGSHRTMLEAASETETPIMVFVGNHGCIQIFTGKVERLVEARGWYNVLDPGFNLHVRESDIAEAWVVRKPTSDGIVTSLELYDAQGENIALFFGSRKESIAENPVWRSIIEKLPAVE